MKLLAQVLSASLCLSFAASAFAESTAGYAEGYTYPAYSSPGVPLLDSFYLRYTGDDHHVESFGVQPQSAGNILLVLGDDNNDDEYYYSVEHKRRTTAGIVTGSFVDFCNGSCLYPLNPPGSGYTFALRGFRFYFRNGDHHLDQVGILREAAGVRTYFNDDNDDDPYAVFVDYAWLPNSMVQTSGQLTGTATGGVQRALTNASSAIITGFLVDYRSSDHHVQEIGVFTRTSDVQIYYGDDNADDAFSYRVDYSLLRLVISLPPIGGIIEAAP